MKDSKLNEIRARFENILRELGIDKDQLRAIKKARKSKKKSILPDKEKNH